MQCMSSRLEEDFCGNHRPYPLGHLAIVSQGLVELLSNSTVCALKGLGNGERSVLMAEAECRVPRVKWVGEYKRMEERKE
jgi:hypothetical protein